MGRRLSRQQDVLASVVVIVALAAGFTACGGGEGEESREASSSPVPTSTPASTPAREAPVDLELFFPHGIAVSRAGVVFVADTDSSRVLRINRDGEITNVAGKADFHGFEGDGGQAADALLYGPTGLALDDDDNLYIVDHGNNRVRRVDKEGTITTVIGSGAAGASGDGGPATGATLQEPLGIAVDRSGSIFLADRDNYRVRAVDTDGTIGAFAGNGSIGPKLKDGPATEAEFGLPVGVATGAGGAVFVSDEPAHRILKVDAEGSMTTYAGTGKPGYGGDGGPATEAELNGPYHMASDARGNLYFADTGNHVIRVVDRKGNIRTVAGTGRPGFRGDGGPATKARLNEPYAVAVDGAGALYITDYGNSRVRRVNRSGTIATIAP